MRRALGLAWIAAAVLAVAGGYFYENETKVEQSTVELKVLDARLNPYSHQVDSVMFEFPGGKRMLLNKMDFHENKLVLDTVWATLKSSQVLKYEHRIEYWLIFGRVVVKSHIDHLSPAD